MLISSLLPLVGQMQAALTRFAELEKRLAVSGGTGADFEGGGTVTNSAGSSIVGASFGAYFSGENRMFANTGSIAGTNVIGIDLSAG